MGVQRLNLVLVAIMMAAAPLCGAWTGLAAQPHHDDHAHHHHHEHSHRGIVHTHVHHHHHDDAASARDGEHDDAEDHHCDLHHGQEAPRIQWTPGRRVDVELHAEVETLADVSLPHPGDRAPLRRPKPPPRSSPHGSRHVGLIKTVVLRL